MKKLSFPVFVLGLCLACCLSACDTGFQDNPHGAVLLNQMTPVPITPIAVKAPLVAFNPHLSPFGFGASLQALVVHYGQPTKYSVPPLYIFQAGNTAWPQGSLVVVTMNNNQAVEFAYDPGTSDPMTYQQAQDFAAKLLPDDVQAPKTVQQEDDHAGKCLAKTYQSNVLKTVFSADDFMSPDGKDGDPGSVTVNFYPDAQVATEQSNLASMSSSSPIGAYVNGGNNFIQSAVQVNSVLVNLGNRPSC